MKLIKANFLFILFLSTSLYSQTTEKIYLSGHGKDDPVEWEFYCTEGANSGEWTKIGVPSCWELKGFGTYNYGHDIKKEKKDPSIVLGKEEGIYKYHFTIPEAWENKHVNIVFDGVMTDAQVKINGKDAGPVHQGAFYRFKYDISKRIKPLEKNLLEVNVSKHSSNPSVNKAERVADYWIFGGIFRPVYLEALPVEHIERVAIDARAEGEFSMQVFTNNAKPGTIICSAIKTKNGELISEIKKPVEHSKEYSLLTTKIDTPELWSPEFPHLHEVEVWIEDKNGAAIHKITETFGFRTVEFKEKDGIYVNGEKILFKGINHHCFHPESGRTTSKQLSVEDVLLIKEMNMNAVRMSHYPPDKHFLDACDSLGLFVLNELAGWHQSYDTATGKKLVKEMVVRDVNHPSIVLWSNGNEGGWNRELDVEFEKYDPQGRKVIHPFEIFDGTNTGHYKSYNYLCQSLVESNDVFFPTELLHGLYDGGHAAGLKDYWDIMLKEPLSAGCFLWAFLDEAVRRNDKDNQLDTDGNHGADGIVGPYREKEGSFYAVREIWSPIHIHKKFITPAFDGSLLLENRYHFTNLKQCQMEWKLARTPEIDGNHSKVGENKSGRIDIPDIAPGMKGWLKINLPDDWNSYDVLYVTAKDPYGREIFTWSWPLKTNQQLVEQIVDLQEDGAFGVKESDKQLVVKTGKHQFVFDMETGYIEKVIANNKEIPFSNGPAPSHDSLALESLVHGKENGEYVIRCKYVSGFENITWSINPSGWLNLKYSYRPETDQYENLGVNFDFPEDKISSLKFLGDGPYRVWKNRMEGNLYGVWDKSYNNTITGKTWDYPEFKGHYSNFSWAKIITNDVPFYIVSATDGLFLRMLTPEFPDDAMFAKANFPGGSISVLNAIPPIGSKVHRPEQLGPRSDYYEFQNWIKSNPPLGGDIYLFFGKLDK